MNPKHRFFTLLKALQEDLSDSTIIGHEIHEKHENGFEGKWLGFVENFCGEVFSHSFDKCLGQLKATFDPSKEQYPPFFDLNKHITEVEVNKIMAQEIPFLNRFIGASEASGTIIEPIPELTNDFKLFKLGIIFGD